ncbi:helix-turn-helix domain-containing protein [Halotia branconii]|uniref:Helix-turn-helix transcriptional regulator n=1 Tax=Halotia branconii CENA392 TaxID=1539056 RepID=A0AAJ6NNC3_9CYAN|nr:helix-turn-helix transcriptional regulator [Halotia branconii]WGV23689.1 helix-turn-helix transcriptional regulator [Halotia branconii CENA392]
MINEKPNFVEGVSFLRQLREALNLTREQFAVKIGTTGSTVYRWETGRHPVSFNSRQWKSFHKEVLEPLGINVYDLPDDLGAPYKMSA